MNKQKILIVDDNFNFVERMIGLLRDVSVVEEIYTASDYDEAQRLFMEVCPDIVLLDINLPGKNGIELLKIFKKNRCECKVIMITNHADDYYRQQCHDLGANHFLDKSNDFSLVADIVGEK